MKMPDKGKMVFDIQMRRCTEYMSEQSFGQATQLLNALHSTCTLPDGSDDQNGKGQEITHSSVLNPTFMSFGQTSICHAVTDSRMLSHSYHHAGSELIDIYALQMKIAHETKTKVCSAQAASQARIGSLWRIVGC